MKISDVVKTTATFLAREDVVDYLSNTDNAQTSNETLETVQLLTRLTNLVIRELAEGLIVMKKEVILNGQTSVKFIDLDIAPLDLLAVYGKDGERLEYSLTSYGVEARNPMYKLEYSYLPENYGLTDDIGIFDKPVTVGTLTYGVLAEFCITQARFDEAVMWNERFVELVHSLVKPKNGRIKGRSFI